MPGGAGPHWGTLELFEAQGQPSDGAQGHGRLSAPGVTGLGGSCLIHDLSQELEVYSWVLSAP